MTVTGFPTSLDPTSLSRTHVRTQGKGDDWHPTDTAPDDGAVILGRYDDTEREIRWARNRPGRMGAGWVAVEDGDYIDPPQSWRPVAPVEHLLSDDCPCEPYIDGPSARLHRGNPTNIVFVPSPGDDVDAAGHALVDHR